MSDRTLLRDALGHFVSPYNAEFKARVRADYENPDVLLREITENQGISASTLQQWVRAGGWEMRQPHRIDPNNLVGRMLVLLDGQIADLEIVMKNGATEVAMLSKLVTTLDRVLALKERSAQTQKRPSMRVATLRTKIADRLAELNRA
jgi:transposase-like protein